MSDFDPTRRNDLSRMTEAEIVRLRSMINSGYGRTNKPLPPKRLDKLKRKLADIEAALNGR